MRRRQLVSAIGASFCCGALVTTAMLRVPPPAPPAASGPEAAGGGDTPGPSEPAPRGTSGDGVVPEAVSEPEHGATGTARTADLRAATEELAARDLLFPVEGMDADDLVDTFSEARGTGRHEALDILAPRRTKVRAVEDGRIVRLFTSKRGGLTVYQFDPTSRYCYYYAHLDAYADDLAEGREVERGEVIGYVGTTGNAPAGTPHLHFAVFLLGPARRWWEGTPINPYDLFER